MSLKRMDVMGDKTVETIVLSESISFRINKKTLEKLRANALSEKTTLNAIVNHLLTFSAEWLIPAAKTGWVPIPKESLMAMFDILDVKQIEKIGKMVGKSVPKDLLLGMTGNVSAGDWVKILRNRAEAAGMSYTEITENNEKRIIQQHNMGEKWSIYWHAYYIESFKQLDCEIKCSFTDNTIVYSIPLKFLN